MEEDWRKCILTHIDIIGVKALANRSKGSSIMRDLHQLVDNDFGKYLPGHDHAYVWNDSVLIVAFLNKGRGEKLRLLQEVNAFKRHLDKTLAKRSFAVVVEGKTFPIGQPLSAQGLKGANRSKVTVLKASSWALANCFEIERELRKYKKSWYIDIRVSKGITTLATRNDKLVKLLPSNRERIVSMYDGDLW